MNKNIVYAGLGITAIGLALLFLFIPLSGISAVDLGKDYDKGDFKSYSDGDKVTVYGEITDVEEDDNGVWLELDGQDFPVFIDGGKASDYKVGDEVIIHATVVEKASINIPWWGIEVRMEILSATPGDVQYKTTLEGIFALIAVAGFITILVGAVKN